MIFDRQIILYKNVNYLLKFNYRCFSSHVKTPENDIKYKHTINLPKTKFPLRLSAPKRDDVEKRVLNLCFNHIYAWQRDNLKDPEFILHDGPPYANGVLHMGHAVNKILKDIVLRHHISLEQKINFIPGWDCHGLPIELKALKEGNENRDPKEIRKIAREFAENNVKQQSKGFRSWGIIGEWDSSDATYRTIDKNYIINELKIFQNLYKNKYIYRVLKPVHWSPSSRTALAEAELEYDNNFISPSVYLRFRVTNISSQVCNINDDVYALVWTTTPWTLPSNQAICFNPALQYSLIRFVDKNGAYIISTELETSISEVIGKFDVISTFSGSLLKSAKYQQLFSTESLSFLSANHVQSNKGTGLVHTAPAHGPDDFLSSIEHKLVVKCIVDENGDYTHEAPQFLHGKNVLRDGNQFVMEALQSDIVQAGKLEHSYPIDWRTKEPVIIRASKQWFIDTEKIKSKSAELIENDIEFYPKTSSDVNKRNLLTQVLKRPYWCISRQRSWGVPIPVFYLKDSDEEVVNDEIIDHVVKLVDEEGSIDFWWTKTANDLLPQSIKEKMNGRLEKGNDIFDIWFDSGTSWSSVIGKDKVADLYIEGQDQCTGWFQTSLLTSCAVRQKSPFKSLFIHGFTVDSNGLKMSKSLGNVISPADIISTHGTDALRWWVASHATQHSQIEVSKRLLDSSTENVQKVRSVLRFILGIVENIKNKNSKLNISDCNDYHTVDRAILYKLNKFDIQMTSLYQKFQFNRATTNILNFVTNDLSAFYLHLVKDRLYCDSKDNYLNLQRIFDVILSSLSKHLYPIVPFLVEEVWSYYDSQPFYKHKSPDLTKFQSFEESNKIIEKAMELSALVNHQKMGRNSWTLRAEITCDTYNYNILTNLHPTTNSFIENSELCEILQLSSINLKNHTNSNYDIHVEPIETVVCPRCRRFPIAHPDNSICSRCTNILSNI